MSRLHAAALVLSSAPHSRLVVPFSHFGGKKKNPFSEKIFDAIGRSFAEGICSNIVQTLLNQPGGGVHLAALPVCPQVLDGPALLLWDHPYEIHCSAQCVG